jgi:hypothetical protein
MKIEHGIKTGHLRGEHQLRPQQPQQQGQGG